MTNGYATKTITGYNMAGQVKSEQKVIVGNGGVYYTTQYSYDLSGKLTNMVYPDGYGLNYAYYPGSGLLYTVRGASDNKRHALFAAYQPTGKAGEITSYNNVKTQNTYDPESNRLTRIYTLKQSSPTAVLQDRDYNYTAAGDISQIIDNVKNITYNYSYDGLHRLRTETMIGGSYPATGYAYDSVGNITSKTVGSNTYTYAYTSDRCQW